MSYTNERMPEIVPRVEIDELLFEKNEVEIKFWRDKYISTVRKMNNMVDACNEWGFVEISWREKRFKFTMEEIE